MPQEKVRVSGSRGLAAGTARQLETYVARACEDPVLMGQGTQLLSAAEGDCTQPRCVLEDFPCAALLFDRHGNLLASNAKADDLHIGGSRIADQAQQQQPLTSSWLTLSLSFSLSGSSSAHHRCGVQALRRACAPLKGLHPAWTRAVMRFQLDRCFRRCSRMQPAYSKCPREESLLQVEGYLLSQTLPGRCTAGGTKGVAQLVPMESGHCTGKSAAAV